MSVTVVLNPLTARLFWIVVRDISVAFVYHVILHTNRLSLFLRSAFSFANLSLRCLATRRNAARDDFVFHHFDRQTCLCCIPIQYHFGFLGFQNNKPFWT